MNADVGDEFLEDRREALDALRDGLSDPRSISCRWTLRIPVGAAGWIQLSVDADPWCLSLADRDWILEVAGRLCNGDRTTVDFAAARQTGRTEQWPASLGQSGDGNLRRASTVSPTKSSTARRGAHTNRSTSRSSRSRKVRRTLSTSRPTPASSSTFPSPSKTCIRTRSSGQCPLTIPRKASDEAKP